MRTLPHSHSPARKPAASHLHTTKEPMTRKVCPLPSCFISNFKPLLVFLISTWKSQNYWTLGNRPSDTLSFSIHKNNVIPLGPHGRPSQRTLVQAHTCTATVVRGRVHCTKTTQGTASPESSGGTAKVSTCERNIRTSTCRLFNFTRIPLKSSIILKIQLSPGESCCQEETASGFHVQTPEQR